MDYIYANAIVIASNFITVNSQLRMFSTPCILFSLQITTFIYSGIILWFKRIGHLWIDALLGLGWKTWISWMEHLRPLQEIKLLFRVYKYLWFKIVLRDIKRGSDSLFYLNLWTRYTIFKYAIFKCWTIQHLNILQQLFAILS